MSNLMKKSENTVSTSIGSGAKPKTQFSEFDLSQMKFMNLNEGAIIPLDVIPVVPKTRIKRLSYDLSVLTRNPTVRQYRGGFRVYVKSFYSKSTDLWEGAEIFYNPEKDTPELSQYADLQIPKYEPCYINVGKQFFSKVSNADDFYGANTISMFSPLGYMGVPPIYINPATKDFIPRSIHESVFMVGGESYSAVSPSYPAFTDIQKTDWMPMYDSTGHTTESHFGFYSLDNNGKNTYNGFVYMQPGKWPFKVGNSYSVDAANETLTITGDTNTKPELEYHNMINALPLVMYTRIYRDFFMNKSLMTQYPNTYKLWYPTKSEDFRLPIDPKNILCSGNYALPGQSAYTSTWNESTDVGFRLGYEEHNQVNCVSLKHPLLPNKAICDLLSASGDTNPLSQYGSCNANYERAIPDPMDYFKDHIINCSNDDTLPIPPLLNRTYFADYTSDYFGKVSPFPDLMRHSLPTMENTLGDVYADFEKSVMTDGASINISAIVYGQDTTPGSDNNGFTVSDIGHSSNHTNLVNALNKNEIALSQVQTNFTMNALRNFKYANMIAEKLSRTNGTYNKNHMAFFGGGKVLHDGTPTYIGGFYQDIVFNETVGTSDANQGDKVSNGISINSGYITNNFTCEDYGYVMTIAYIVPNTISRPTGIARWMMANSQDDVYLPEKNALPSDALYKYEMDIFQSNSNLPYAFQPKFEYLKHRTNIALNMFGRGDSAYDSAMLSTRCRTTQFSPWANKVIPTFAFDKYVKTFDRKGFTSLNEPLFDAEVVANVKVIMPMPYEAKPMEVI